MWFRKKWFSFVAHAQTADCPRVFWRVYFVCFILSRSWYFPKIDFFFLDSPKSLKSFCFDKYAWSSVVFFILALDLYLRTWVLNASTLKSESDSHASIFFASSRIRLSWTLAACVFWFLSVVFPLSKIKKRKYIKHAILLYTHIWWRDANTLSSLNLCNEQRRPLPKLTHNTRIIHI